MPSVLPLKTAMLPNPLLPMRDPDEIRNMALSIEDEITGDEDCGVHMDRVAAIFVRGALLDFADMIERYG